jgi:C-terminal processing protease CtpA/Prc
VRLVGEPTSGLATELQVVPLQSGGVLRLSVARAKTAGGRSLAPKGLEPDDRVFEALPEEGQPAVDAQMKRALRILAEKPAAGGPAA